MIAISKADKGLLFSSWHDRIPLTLLFGISTSVELFEARLPRSSIALLKGRFFELHEASNCVDHIYERIQTEGGKLWLGRGLTGVLFEKSSDYFQTPESFCRTVKVFPVHSLRLVYANSILLVRLHVSLLR
jgi:origin recognition complex subunit 3